MATYSFVCRLPISLSIIVNKVWLCQYLIIRFHLLCIRTRTEQLRSQRSALTELRELPHTLYSSWVQEWIGVSRQEATEVVEISVSESAYPQKGRTLSFSNVLSYFCFTFQHFLSCFLYFTVNNFFFFLSIVYSYLSIYLVFNSVLWLSFLFSSTSFIFSFSFFIFIFNFSIFFYCLTVTGYCQVHYIAIHTLNAHLNASSLSLSLSLSRRISWSICLFVVVPQLMLLKIC